MLCCQYVLALFHSYCLEFWEVKFTSCSARDSVNLSNLLTKPNPAQLLPVMAAASLAVSLNRTVSSSKECEGPLQFMECEFSGVNIKSIPLAELGNKTKEVLPRYLFSFHLLFELVSVSEISTGMISLKLGEENVKRKVCCLAV